MTPLVSILIPSFNAERWIFETVQSAINQTWQRKEIIVVDDGSIDNTLNILKRCESEIVKIVAQKNMGAPAARNRALSLAQGDYIQWLDHDDVLAPDKIALQIAMGDGGQNSRILLSCAFGTFYNKVEKAKFSPSSLWKDLTPIEYFLIKFQENTWFQPGAWLVSRRIAELAGPYHELRSPDDDGEYFCRVVAASERIKFVFNAKAYWRIGNAKSLSQVFDNEASESAFISTIRSIETLLSLEDSDRTRRASIKFIQDRMTWFYPDKKDILDRASRLASELGGELTPPDDGWKFGIAQKLLGWGAAKLLRKKGRMVKTALNRERERLF